MTRWITCTASLHALGLAAATDSGKAEVVSGSVPHVASIRGVLLVQRRCRKIIARSSRRAGTKLTLAGIADL